MSKVYSTVPVWSEKRVYSADEIEKKRLMALDRRKLAECTRNFERQLNPSKFNNRGRNPLVVISSSQTNNRYDPLKREEQQSNLIVKEKSVTAKCFIVAENRFGIQISTESQPVIDILKTISGGSYDSKTKIWDFHINDYDTVIKKLSDSQLRVTVVKLPNLVLQIFKKDLNTNYNSIDLSTIDPKLLKSLMPFQREGICHGIANNGRCFIADDMGLGKTVQALGIAHYYRSAWPLLIVSPSSVGHQWISEIHKFLPSVPKQYIRRFANAEDSVGDARIVIMSYDVLRRATDRVVKYVFGVVIFDESHLLKNVKSARTEAATRISAQARSVILLSGTPAPSRPMELYSQMCLIVPNFFDGIRNFGVRYCAGCLGDYGWEYSSDSNMQELRFLLKRCGLIRRTKSEVTQLPSKTREVVKLDPELINDGTKEMQRIKDRLYYGKLTAADWRQNLLLYYSGTAIAKLKAINAYVVDLLKSRTKFLIFAHHLAVLDSISERLRSKKVKFIRIDGLTKPEDRKFQCDRFQKRKDYLVAVLSVTAANTGITLTAAQRVIFAELYWNPGQMLQAEDRVHRIGQEENVLIQFLLANNTSDDLMWPMIQSKMKVLSSAELGHNFFQQKTMCIKNQTYKCAKDDSSASAAEENEMDFSESLETDYEDLSMLDFENFV